MHADLYPVAPTEPLLLATLVVDDDDAVRSTLQRFLSSIGHEVTTAPDAATALAEASRRKLSCVLLDIRLPDGSGIDLVPMLIEREPHVAIVMMTGVNDAAAAVLCMQRGAMEYLLKPVDLKELEQSITRALARRREMIEQADTQTWLQREIVQRGAELRRERGNLEQISVATLEALVNALEAKDVYLRGHSTRVADLSAMIAAELGLSDEKIEQVRVAGRLHDIGKIGIRESVLARHGPLTAEEFEHVKTHVIIGAQILAPLSHLREVISFVRSHHERADGTGYPDGLAHDAIPMGGRILGAAEVYDALTTARPYQEKMTPEEAVARMRDLIGTVITADVHRALSAVVARHRALVFLDDRETLE
jgi:putative two-component system response regulator